MSSGLDIPAGTATTWLIPDMDAAVDVLDLNNATLYPMGIQPALGNNNEIEEDDLGAYLQGDFNFDLGGRTLRGNLGVRYVETDQTSDGIHVRQRHAARRADYGDARILDTLPSLNLVYDFTDEFLVRLGASKVMTRPEPRQPESGRRGERLRAITAPSPPATRNSIRSARTAVRPRLRMVFRAGVAAVRRAVLQGHRVVRADDPRDATVHRQSAGTARQRGHRRLRRTATDARRTPTGISTCRPTRRAAI